MSEPVHRAGVVALLGRPNAGKSTLLNRLLGERLSIVTARPQTTRSCILGILTEPDVQMLFLDTPGFHDSERPLNRALGALVDEAARDCDVALLLVDPEAGWDAGHAALLARLAAGGTAVVVVGTKLDRPGAAAAPWPPPGCANVAAVLRVAARSGTGLEELLAQVKRLLPEGPRFYGEEELTDRPLRFLAAERVREVAFEELAQEVPYALAVEVEEYDESDPRAVRIRANLLVERASLKPIVVGSGGEMIRRIGTEARRRIAELVGRPVHLALWVKVEPRWSKRPERLRALGYR